MTSTASPLQCFRASNTLTYGSLLAGIAAIGCAVEGRPGASGALIALAVVLDTFDGRFAGLFRRSGAQRAIGVQLDSLSDAVAFGLAPAMCIGWSPAASGQPAIVEGFWWASVFLFAACAISRLAFYNVTHEERDGFIGLPAPVAALVWATALLLNPGVPGLTAIFSVTAAAMVLPLPIPRPRGIAFAAFVCWPLLVIAGHVL